MLVPAIALKTFQELKDHAKYRSLVDSLISLIQNLPSALERARTVHHILDEVNKPVFADPLVQKFSPCKLGCTGCCHTQVSVTEDEGKLLAEKVKNGTVQIDLDSLRRQMKAGNDSKEFFAIPYEQRRCVFLNDSGGCSVYHDRPSVCRTNAVLGNSDQCDTQNGPQSQRLVKTTQGDLVIYAAFMQSKNNGALPYILARELELLDD